MPENIGWNMKNLVKLVIRYQIEQNSIPNCLPGFKVVFVTTQLLW